MVPITLFAEVGSCYNPFHCWKGVTDAHVGQTVNCRGGFAGRPSAHRTTSSVPASFAGSPRLVPGAAYRPGPRLATTGSSITTSQGGSLAPPARPCQFGKRCRSSPPDFHSDACRSTGSRAVGRHGRRLSRVYGHRSATRPEYGGGTQPHRPMG